MKFLEPRISKSDTGFEISTISVSVNPYRFNRRQLRDDNIKFS